MPQCFRILSELDQFRNWHPNQQYCCNKCYGLANSDVVETVTFETETETWLKFRDETETVA